MFIVCAREIEEMIESRQVENSISRENHVERKPRVLFPLLHDFDGDA